MRCFKSREYNHFAKDCPNATVTEKNQTEQMQMFYSEEQETTLKVITDEIFDSLTRAYSEEND